MQYCFKQYDYPSVVFIGVKSILSGSIICTFIFKSLKEMSTELTNFPERRSSFPTPESENIISASSPNDSVKKSNITRILDRDQDPILGNVRIIKLKADIAAMDNRLKALRKERMNQKELQVSPTELTLLKSQIRYSYVDKESQATDDIIQMIVEESRKSRYLSDQKQILEQQINDAIRSRDIQVSETQLINDTLDFSDIVIDPIKFTDVDKSSIDGLQLQISLLKSRYESVQLDLDHLNKETPLFNNPTQSLINDIFKAHQSSWRVTCIGKRDVQKEIKELNGSISISESINLNLESEIKHLYKDKQERDESNQATIETLVAQVNNNYSYFNQETLSLNNQKEQLERQLNSLSNANSQIDMEIETIQRHLSDIHEAENNSSNDSKSNGLNDVNSEAGLSKNDDISDNASNYQSMQQNTLENVLILRKRTLMTEISDLKAKFEETKSSFQSSISRKKNYITTLKTRYNKVKLLISEEREGIPSDIGYDINKLAKTVDENLMELREFVSTITQN